jgi:hypothetical protein
MKRSDSLASCPPHFVSFARRRPPLASVFAPARSDADSGARGFRVWQPLGQPACEEAATGGRPKFLENPVVPMPCSLTPAGPNAPGRYGAPTWPPFTSRRGLPREVISGLHGTASARAVYASPPGLPATDARLASGCWPSSARRDWLPAGFQRKVSGLLLTSLPPSPSFLAQDASPLFSPVNGHESMALGTVPSLVAIGSIHDLASGLVRGRAPFGVKPRPNPI